ncbi:hypothetical protein GCM10025785_14140 [Corynebacterium canis]
MAAHRNAPDKEGGTPQRGRCSSSPKHISQTDPKWVASIAWRHPKFRTCFAEVSIKYHFCQGLDSPRTALFQW